MTPFQMRKLDTELREYIDSMVAGMGRQERRRAMELYLILLGQFGCFSKELSLGESPGGRGK